VLSGRVIFWRFEVVRLWGRRPFGGCVVEVADAFLTLMFDGIGGYIVCRM
jgi:hypothetical protein